MTSPLDSSVTHGHLCIKGRFGFEFVQNRAGSGRVEGAGGGTAGGGEPAGGGAAGGREPAGGAPRGG